jgi:hypothetical protein
MGAAASLQPLQRGLEAIYALRVPHNVDDFLCTNRELARFLGGGRPLRGAREGLFVHEQHGELNLSLFLDQRVIAALDAAPGGSGGAGLDDFCQALEGVSHFLYLVWYATHERHVTLLEMELQAEIDKYVMLRGVSADGSDGLLGRLFREAEWCAGLEPGELERYREASRLAERYCRSLEQRFIRGGNRSELLRELRVFYRRSRDDKLHHIRTLS